MPNIVNYMPNIVNYIDNTNIEEIKRHQIECDEKSKNIDGETYNIYFRGYTTSIYYKAKIYDRQTEYDIDDLKYINSHLNDSDKFLYENDKIYYQKNVYCFNEKITYFYNVERGLYCYSTEFQEFGSSGCRIDSHIYCIVHNGKIYNKDNSDEYDSQFINNNIYNSNYIIYNNNKLYYKKETFTNMFNNTFDNNDKYTICQVKNNDKYDIFSINYKNRTYYKNNGIDNNEDVSFYGNGQVIYKDDYSIIVHEKEKYYNYSDDESDNDSNYVPFAINESDNESDDESKSYDSSDNDFFSINSSDIGIEIPKYTEFSYDDSKSYDSNDSNDNESYNDNNESNNNIGIMKKSFFGRLKKYIYK
jgi:hypothetical protein